MIKQPRLASLSKCCFVFTDNHANLRFHSHRNDLTIKHFRKKKITLLNLIFSRQPVVSILVLEVKGMPQTGKKKNLSWFVMLS